jgi:hypothetical protein
MARALPHYPVRRSGVELTSFSCLRSRWGGASSPKSDLRHDHTEVEELGIMIIKISSQSLAQTVEKHGCEIFRSASAVRLSIPGEEFFRILWLWHAVILYNVYHFSILGAASVTPLISF